MADTNGVAATNGAVAAQPSVPAAAPKDPKQTNGVLKENGKVELSNAEKKKLAKAEKAAKRAADKVVATPSIAAKAGPATQAKPETSQGQQGAQRRPSMHRSQADPKVQDSKPQQNKGASGAAKAEKQLPLRGRKGSQSTGSDAMQETKQVSFFAHLYGQPRRQTLEGSAKDVHPAIQALGLQLSNYTICGSHARCVAMLLALKSVRVIASNNVKLLPNTF